MMKYRSRIPCITLAALLVCVPSSISADIYIVQPGDPTNNYAGQVYTVDTNDPNSFDYLMRTYALTNTIVYIAPGTNLTKGVWNQSETNFAAAPGFRVQSGVKIRGITGPDSKKPMLKLIGVCPNDTRAPANVVVSTMRNDLPPGTGNIEVSNLVVNCNAAVLTTNNATPMQLLGVELYGNSLLISDVDVLGATQPDIIAGPGTTESFIISVNADSGITTNNLIRRCTVSNFFNLSGYGKCSAISLNRWGAGEGYIIGRIEDCKVSLNGYGGEFAYNATRTISCVMSNNIAINAQRGFNNDTPSNLGMVFVRNTIHLPRVSYGMLLMNDSRWCRLYENAVWMKDDYSSAFVLTGSWVDGTNHYAGVSNMLFDHNTIDVETNLTGPTWGFNLAPGLPTPYPPSAIDVEHNLLDSLFSNAVPTSVGYTYANTNGTDFPSGVNVGWRYTPCRADLNLDSNIDLVLQDSGNYVQTWLMSSNGTKLSEATLYPGVTWKVFGSGDINRDGRTDLFLQDSSTGNLGYWLFRDTNLISGAEFPAENRNPGSSWKAVASADFNNDNKPDLLFQMGVWLSVWQMDGVTMLPWEALDPSTIGGLGGTNENWKAVGTGDFNHDGHADILFQYDDVNDENLDGKLAVWLMEGLTRASSLTNTPARPDDRNFRVVAVGDFGTSGGSPAYHDDIAFQKRGSTNLLIWFMDGCVTSSAVTLSTTNSYRVVAPK